MTNLATPSVFNNISAQTKTQAAAPKAEETKASLPNNVSNETQKEALALPEKPKTDTITIAGKTIEKKKAALGAAAVILTATAGIIALVNRIKKKGVENPVPTKKSPKRPKPRHNRKPVNTPAAAPAPTTEETVQGIIENYKNGDSGAKKIVDGIVKEARQNQVKEEIETLYSNLEDDLKTVLGEDFKKVLTKRALQGESIPSAEALKNIGKDNLERLLKQKDGAKRILAYIKASESLQDAQKTGNELLKSLLK